MFLQIFHPCFVHQFLLAACQRFQNDFLDFSPVNPLAFNFPITLVLCV